MRVYYGLNFSSGKLSKAKVSGTDPNMDPGSESASYGISDPDRHRHDADQSPTLVMWYLISSYRRLQSRTHHRLRHNFNTANKGNINQLKTIDNIDDVPGLEL